MSDDGTGSMTRRQFMRVSAAASLVAAPAGRMMAKANAGGSQRARAGTTTVARYIAARLKQHGAKILFGVPGATCDPLFAAAESEDMTIVVTSSDLEAGYAADGYARMRGLAAASVTYGVGTLSLISVIAGAYAERSPVAVINGGPSTEDLRLQKELGTFFTHSFGKEKPDLAMFREVTEYAERAERASDVPAIVDNAIQTALRAKRPVYIEIAKHLWDANCPGPAELLDASVPPSGEEEGVAARVFDRLRSAARPALLLGIEVQRYGLAAEATAMVQKLGLPWATTLLAKSVIPEQTSGFVGVYSGEHAMAPVRKAIEGADALLAIGCVMGRHYRHLVTGSKGSLMQVANGLARIGGKPPTQASLAPFVAALQRHEWQPKTAPAATRPPGLSFKERRASLSAVATPTGEQGMTYDEVMEGVSDLLDDGFVAITDTSLSTYPAAEMDVKGSNGFVCNAVWQSIGFSVGASVGVGLAQGRRPIVICGDGGFQMTAQSLSTLAKRKIRSIVVVLDNGVYAIEQWLLDPVFFKATNTSGRPYLELNRWNYVDLAKALGVSVAMKVESASELRQALATAKAAEGPVVISATIKRHDLPSELRPSPA
jgi:indolepyruvate decarboxylase